MKMQTRTESGNFRFLTNDQILPHLQWSISHASQHIIIVGPWLDAYFAGKVIDSLPHLDLAVSFLVRVEEDGEIDAKTLSALNLAQRNIKNFQARALPQLHAKVIIIDNETFYLGSANWYWYSLHKSLETMVTGETSLIPELLSVIDNYWEKATPLARDDLEGYHDLEPLKNIIHSKID